MVTLRWKLADEEGESGQGALFDADELLGRHVGSGEFAGIEFLHVNARQVINRVPASSRMPFQYTINAYRGCTHACVYCAEGSTPVLLGDGRVKNLADIRPGDLVMGTERCGAHLRPVPTPVLDHWPVVRRAWETVLSDGTRLVTSRDHRFLTDRGWRFVAETGDEVDGRSHLTTSDRLVSHAGSGCWALPSVVSVRDLGREIPMYDITTGTGDYVSAGVISHNCFARPTHDYLGLGIGEDFERKIVVKVNAVERVRAELASPKWGGDPIAMGTNTDPYQRCEGKYHLTRGIIEALSAAGNPFSILTKSSLVVRDLDLLVEASRRAPVRVSFSVGTLDEDVWRSTEPGTPHPRQRLNALHRLAAAGLECGVLVAPIIPGISDDPDRIRQVVEACWAAGARSVSTVGLHLRPGVKEHYLGWLQSHRPDLVPTYRRLYRGGSYLPSSAQSRLAAVTERARPRE